jgi:2-methylisocitrate lyase-like PEP mutase family enzyme
MIVEPAGSSFLTAQKTRGRARGEAYAEAGADGVLIHSKQKTPDEILAFCRAWSGRVPLVLVPTSYPQLSFADVAALGKVGLIICDNHAIRAPSQRCEAHSAASWLKAELRAWRAISPLSRRSLRDRGTSICGSHSDTRGLVW